MLLPLEDRVQLASGLLASLDRDDIHEGDVERLCSTETERRAAELASGNVMPVTWDHVVEAVDGRRA